MDYGNLNGEPIVKIVKLYRVVDRVFSEIRIRSAIFESDTLVQGQILESVYGRSLRLENF